MKYCNNCGMQMHDTDFICPACGKIYEDVNSQNNNNNHNLRMAIVISVSVVLVVAIICIVLVASKNTENNNVSINVISETTEPTTTTTTTTTTTEQQTQQVIVVTQYVPASTPPQNSDGAYTATVKLRVSQGSGNILNIRSGPSYSNGVVGQVYNGTQLTVYKEQGGWAYVGYSGGMGWVNIDVSGIHR